VGNPNPWAPLENSRGFAKPKVECLTTIGIWIALGGSTSEFKNGGCCGVNGVYCDSTSTFVEKIDWAGKGLSGSIPEAIATLTSLSSL
jgi:hypothetical protein